MMPKNRDSSGIASSYTLRALESTGFGDGHWTRRTREGRLRDGSSTPL